MARSLHQYNTFFSELIRITLVFATIQDTVLRHSMSLLHAVENYFSFPGGIGTWVLKSGEDWKRHSFVQAACEPRPVNFEFELILSVVNMTNGKWIAVGAQTFSGGSVCLVVNLHSSHIFFYSPALPSSHRHGDWSPVVNCGIRCCKASIMSWIMELALNDNVMDSMVKFHFIYS